MDAIRAPRGHGKSRVVTYWQWLGVIASAREQCWHAYLRALFNKTPLSHYPRRTP